MTSNYPKTPHVAQALVMAETLRELYPRGVPRQAANLLREQHAALEKKSDAIQRLWKERDQLRSEIERLRAAVLAEREACAKVCENDGLLWGQRYAAAIRARGER